MRLDLIRLATPIGTFNDETVLIKTAFKDLHWKKIPPHSL